ncbi:hypothetical protein [Cupriavidus sp. UYPR2.512]|uniref:hypothetical protein n=1 Tax=Cupriavidus sp. UYPR2.512 TaxID=1080187 RepID=UPI0012F99CF5|nr:hypothetical protein [Cupriavidus sp. UYPR2.512]UIF86540.1 hypothetical protein KAF44_02440 [Cupriavidus necator]
MTRLYYHRGAAGDSVYAVWYWKGSAPWLPPAAGPWHGNFCMFLRARGIRRGFLSTILSVLIHRNINTS